MVRELTKRERKALKKMFEEKRLRRERKRQYAGSRANRRKRTRGSRDWVGLLDEEARDG